MPKYSIIVPVYNCRKYLPDCVESILNQTVPDFELVLIDDGSTDQSGVICDAYAVRDKRIRAFHKQNGGAASARNYGIDRAIGRYILFVDGDDTITKDCLEAVGKSVSLAELTIFGIQFNYFRGAKLKSHGIHSVHFTGVFTKDELLANFQDFFQDNQLSSACNKLFDKKILIERNIRFQQGQTLYEDFDFVLRYLNAVQTIFCIDRPLYEYRIVLHGPAYRNKRTATTAGIREGLLPLRETAATYYSMYPDSTVPSVMANLYMMLLQQHLIQRTDNTDPQFSQELTGYCNDEILQSAIRAGGVLEGTNKELYGWIRSGDCCRIKGLYRAKRRKAAIRRVIQFFLPSRKEAR